MNENDMDILDDMGVSKLSAKVFFLKWTTQNQILTNSWQQRRLHFSRSMTTFLKKKIVDYLFDSVLKMNSTTFQKPVSLLAHRGRWKLRLERRGWSLKLVPSRIMECWL